MLGRLTVLLLRKRLIIRVLEMTGFSDRCVIHSESPALLLFDFLLLGHMCVRGLMLEARADDAVAYGEQVDWLDGHRRANNATHCLFWSSDSRNAKQRNILLAPDWAVSTAGHVCQQTSALLGVPGVPA